MGINIGSLIGYLVCGWIQINLSYHAAFGAAALGMGIGLVQFKLTAYRLEGLATKPALPLSSVGKQTSKVLLLIFLLTIILLLILINSGQVVLNPIEVAQQVTVVIALLFIMYFVGLFIFGALSLTERKAFGAILLICIASILFWAGFEQAGSSLNLFTRDFTNRLVRISKFLSLGSNQLIRYS